MKLRHFYLIYYYLLIYILFFYQKNTSRDWPRPGRDLSAGRRPAGRQNLEAGRFTTQIQLQKHDASKHTQIII